MVKQNAFRVIAVMVLFLAFCGLHYKGHYLAAAYGHIVLCGLAAYLWRLRNDEDAGMRALAAWAVCFGASLLTYAIGIGWIYHPASPYPQQIRTLNFSSLLGLGLLIGFFAANHWGLIGFKPAQAPSRS